jgi:hypothetical protein
MFRWEMSVLTQAGALGVAAVAFLAFLAMLGLRFMRRGAARHWVAPGATALILLPVVLGAGIAALCFRQALGGMVLPGPGGGAVLAARSAEAMFPLFVGLSVAAPLAWAGLVSMSIGSSRSSEGGGSGGELALPAGAFVAVLLSSVLVVLPVRLVAAVNAGMRGQDLLLRLNLLLAGAALLATLLLGLAVATAIAAPRRASPAGVRVAALSALSLCGLLVLGGFYGVYREIQFYMAAATLGVPGGG